MVNKQYTVQPARKLPNTYHSNNATVSGHPAAHVQPSAAVNNLDSEQQHQRGSGGGARGHPAAMQTVGGATYARNIAYVHNHGPSAHSHTRAEVTDVFAADGADGRVNNLDKDVAIKDIGRFQYILQMDREMVSER